MRLILESEKLGNTCPVCSTTVVRLELSLRAWLQGEFIDNIIRALHVGGLSSSMPIIMTNPPCPPGPSDPCLERPSSVRKALRLARIGRPAHRAKDTSGNPSVPCLVSYYSDRAGFVRSSKFRFGSGMIKLIKSLSWAKNLMLRNVDAMESPGVVSI